MELCIEIPKYIYNKRDVEKAIALAFDESDVLRGTLFRLFKPRNSEKAILTVPNEDAGSFLVSAGKWGRILVGRTELFPKKSGRRPDPNVVKSLMYEQPIANVAKQEKSDEEIRHLLADLTLPNFDEVMNWADDVSESSTQASSAWTQQSHWTSNMPDVEPDEEKVEDISIPVREAWFGVWCDNEATEHVTPVQPRRVGPSAALLPNSQNVGFNQFSLLTPEERGNPTFSPEWKASQIVGMNSFDHPFLEIDGDVIKLKLSADVQIHFFEYDIKSVVLHHTPTESSIYITLAHPPIIADTSVITTMSYADMKKATFSRVPKVNTKHSFFVFNCLVCRITFHPSRTDTVASVFSRIGPSVQSPVLIAPGGLYATKHQEALKKLMSSLPLIIAHQLTIIWTWSIMFPTELVAFTKKSVIPLLSTRPDEETAQLLSVLVRSTPWVPFKGERRPDFSLLFSKIQSRFHYTPQTLDPAKYCMMYQLHITPTGMYLDGPYLDKSNRVIRQYQKYTHHFLHVSFVEEDGTPLSHSSRTDIPHTAIYEDRFAKYLKEGIKLSGNRVFKFLAFSNSSLKEGRVLFFHEPGDGSGVTVEGIRAWMGDFSVIKTPARYAARMGQAFTSTQGTVEVKEGEVRKVADVKRGGYVFSDGVGTVSCEIAEDIWRELKRLSGRGAGKGVDVGGVMERCPSAFQIRFGGAKGMVSVDPSLKGRQLRLRESMVKFESPSRTIEIADDSSQCRDAYLNRQVILILEDLGVSKSVFLDLQRQTVRELAFMWKTPEKLVELAGREGAFGNFVRLWENLGVSISWMENEFVRKSFEHIRGYILKEVKYRARLRIPGGWTLFGVLDETGTLKEGQIFCQISSPTDGEKVITGPAIIYRSPCIHPGDVQPVICVDVPELRHMWNVVVFSQFGNRDLPSKLGGGDLDGDMYTIVTNRSFFPKRSEFRAAAAYTTLTRDAPPDRPVTMDDVADFIVYYMQHDKLGIIARRHLALADQVDGGSTHPNCLLLSELHNHAVDFPKTGIPADIKLAPTTKSRPDFMYRPQYAVKTGYYKSSRVMGLMYRDDELNHLLEQTYRSYDAEAVFYRSPDSDPVWRYIKAKHDDWESYVEAAMKYQYTFEVEMDRIASFCRPKLVEIELWTGYIDMEGRKSHRGLYNLEEWARDQFSALVVKTERLMVQGRSGSEVVGLAVACYYVSNIVKSALPEGGQCWNVFGFLLFHYLVEAS